MHALCMAAPGPKDPLTSSVTRPTHGRPTLCRSISTASKTSRSSSDRSPCLPRLCSLQERASYMMRLAATEMLKDSTKPDMGIITDWSARARASSEMPGRQQQLWFHCQSA